MTVEKKEGKAGPEKVSSSHCPIFHRCRLEINLTNLRNCILYLEFGTVPSSASLILVDSSAHLMGLTFPLQPAMALQLRTHRDERFRDREKINEEVIKG